MRPTRVVNIYRDDYDVDIRRPSIWGNRHVIGPDGTREEVVKKHRHDLLTNPELIKLARAKLKGKRLACVCKQPGRNILCHGDNYVWVCELNDKMYNLVLKQARSCAS